MKRSRFTSSIYIWVVVLLLSIIYIGRDSQYRTGSDMLAGSIASTSQVNNSQHQESAALLDMPDDNSLETRRESNRWATPTTSPRLQYATIRTAGAADAMQRSMRTQNAIQNHLGSSTLPHHHEIERAISSKRFHIGYYLYQRCQMRC